MTITSEAAVWGVISGAQLDGAVIALPSSLLFMDATDIEIIERVNSTDVKTPLTLGVEYSFSVAAGEGATAGTVTLNEAIASGTDWYYRRLTVSEQDKVFVGVSSYRPQALEDSLDRLTLLSQEAKHDNERTLSVPKDESSLDMELPKKSLRANKAFQFDSAGLPSMVVPTDASGTSATATGTVTSRTFSERFADTVHVKDFGATGDGVTDDAAAIDLALAFVNDTGGVLDFRSSNGQTYKSTTGNHVAKGCTILGSGANGRALDLGTNDGTMISFTSGSAANPGIKFGRETRIEGMTFYYPDQNASGSPVAYGATLLGVSDVTGKAANCTIIYNNFINSYIAIDDGGTSAGDVESIGFSIISDNRICAIRVGIDLAGSAAEVYVGRNTLSWGFWTAITTAGKEDITLNAIAIRLGNTHGNNLDGLTLDCNMIFGFNKGYEIQALLNVVTINGGFLDQCYYGIDVIPSGGELHTVRITGVQIISADPNDSTRLDGACIKYRDDVVNGMTFAVSNCIFGNTNGDHIDIASTAGSYSRVIVSNSFFQNAGRHDTSSPQSKEYNSIRIDEGARTDLIVTGCSFENSINPANSETVAIELVDVAMASITNCQFRYMKNCIKATNVLSLVVDANQSEGGPVGADDLVLTSIGADSLIGRNLWNGSDATPGATVTAAGGTITLPASTHYKEVVVTGTDNTTNITATERGREVILRFANVPTIGLVDGGNLSLAGNFVPNGASDTIHLMCDGATWYEISRSNN